MSALPLTNHIIYTIASINTCLNFPALFMLLTNIIEEHNPFRGVDDNDSTDKKLLRRKNASIFCDRF